MKTLSSLLIIVIITAGLHGAEDKIIDFPCPGKTYEVVFDRTAGSGSAQHKITILKVADNGWIYAETSSRRPIAENGKITLKWMHEGKLWLNPNRLESAKEIEN